MGGEIRPFLGQEAVRRDKLSTRQLQKDYQSVYRNVYLPKDAALTALTRARAAWLWSGENSTIVRLSAAAVLGSKWIDPQLPAELSRADRHCPKGMLAHTYDLTFDECCVVDGMRVTTPARTAFDIGRTMRQDDAVVYLDSLARATDLKSADVLLLAERRPGSRGIRRLRETLELIDGGAESPQETRVRLLLLRADMPKPETQIEFADDYGIVRIRVDMGWREWKVAVEYDGVKHWSDRRQRSWDIDRIAMLEAAGWVVIRVSAEMLSRPDVIIERVLRALRAAGRPI
jgi:very-short-patch-repair endonuclease